ncbi:MAG: N-acetylmuramoyl-L-alanine amidase [Bacteroidetes bacterium]|nr:MAG: N-acetylmuramoyl-L-alanine amidase [Bacteroidota bacterium]
MKSIACIVGVLTVAFLTASFAPKIAPEFKVRTVCIDAGHGGKDPGCHGGIAKEKDVALAIALRLGKYIEDNFKDVKVVYTRKTDVFIELNERAAIANRNNAQLFICIHCNSACVRDKKTKKDICKGEVHGAETYVMGLHKNEGNLAVAARENESVLLESDYKARYESLLDNDEARMILSVYQNLYQQQSIDFAQLVQDQFRERCGRKDKEVNQAGFLVLWKTSMPSVLIETGFLTNSDEEKFLGSGTGQEHMAAAIFRAFRKWKNNVEGTSIVYDDEIERMKPFVPVRDTSAKTNPVVKDTVAVKVDTPKVKPVAVNVVFKVQVLSSDKKLDPKSAQLKNLKDYAFYEEKNVYKYTVGEFKSSSDAKAKQNELRKNGFPEAFVIAFNDGVRIPVSEAEKLLKQQ